MGKFSVAPRIKDAALYTLYTSKHLISTSTVVLVQMHCTVDIV